MKNLIIFLLLGFISCNNEEYPKDKIENIDTIQFGQSYGRKIMIYTIDSCEYIGSIYSSYADVLTHKGNCKYCIERNKNK